MNNIPVVQNMPFAFCRKCDKFEPAVSTRREYTCDKNGNRHVLSTVYLDCRNDWLCRQLKDNIDDFAAEFTGGDVN